MDCVYHEYDGIARYGLVGHEHEMVLHYLGVKRCEQGFEVDNTAGLAAVVYFTLESRRPPRDEDCIPVGLIEGTMEE